VEHVFGSLPFIQGGTRARWLPLTLLSITRVHVCKLLSVLLKVIYMFRVHRFLRLPNIANPTPSPLSHFSSCQIFFVRLETCLNFSILTRGEECLCCYAEVKMKLDHTKIGYDFSSHILFSSQVDVVVLVFVRLYCINASCIWISIQYWTNKIHAGKKWNIFVSFYSMNSLIILLFGDRSFSFRRD